MKFGDPMKQEPLSFKQLCLIAKEQFSEHGYAEWLENIKMRIAHMGHGYDSSQIFKAMTAVERAHRLKIEVVYPAKFKLNA